MSPGGRLTVDRTTYGGRIVAIGEQNPIMESLAKVNRRAHDACASYLSYALFELYYAYIANIYSNIVIIIGDSPRTVCLV